MKHEIDLGKYQIRTDLAIEVIDENKKLEGIKSGQRKIGNIKITDVNIDKIGSSIINKKPGNYITIEFNDVTDYNNGEEVKEVFIEELKKLLKEK